jgi:hypothetical protein
MMFACLPQHESMLVDVCISVATMKTLNLSYAIGSAYILITI